MSSQDIAPIFLNDDSILDLNRPLGLGNVSTSVKKCLGPESIGFNNGLYVVHASALAYLADIAIVPKKMRTWIILNDRASVPLLEDRILLNGRIQIYKKHIADGAENVGYDIVADGKIWSGFSQEERRAGASYLGQFLFDGNGNLPQDKIEGIITGYKIQEEQRLHDEHYRDLARMPKEGVDSHRGRGHSLRH